MSRPVAQCSCLVGQPGVPDVTVGLGPVTIRDEADRSLRPTGRWTKRGDQQIVVPGHRTRLPEEAHVANGIPKKKLEHRSVRMLRPESLSILEVAIDIFPTSEDDLSVRQHLRREIGQCVLTDAARVAAVRLHDPEIRASAWLGDQLPARSRGHEHHFTRRKFQRAEVVLGSARAQSLKVGSVHADSVDLPARFRSTPKREQHGARVQGKTHVQDAAVGVREDGACRGRTDGKVPPLNTAAPLFRFGMADHAAGHVGALKRMAGEKHNRPDAAGLFGQELANLFGTNGVTRCWG